MSNPENPSYNPDNVLSLLTALEAEKPGVMKVYNLFRAAEKKLGVKRVAGGYFAGTGDYNAALRLEDAGLLIRVTEDGQEFFYLNKQNIKNIDQPNKN
jgi:hypothetical protein